MEERLEKKVGIVILKKIPSVIGITVIIKIVVKRHTPNNTDIPYAINNVLYFLLNVYLFT
ncbi:hypothetical protein [Melissococcus plutonius]|uniref:hypothetical protein n=1 Tax=Melissococcus plutonius TaxID=33970 RepID=UPI00024F20D8|nr:hypothetical protein [Melissococcus plutonius]BAL61362.1 hypothetical protein MPD5_0054 [Melissococcus plutonius DAT561]